MDMLLLRNWPGRVGEFEIVIHRAVIMAEG